MSCAACIAFDAAERAAIEGVDMPPHAVDGCTCEEPELDVLYVSSEQFPCKPQVGTPLRMTFDMISGYCSRPSIGNAKDVGGAISIALYRDNIRRKNNLVHVWAVAIDVDQNGDVDHVADALANYDAIIHSTFRSTDDAPRCRAFIRLEDPIDATAYDAAHEVVRAHLGARGIVVDAGAKDCSRLSYVPVVRPGAQYRFRRNRGKPLNVARMLAAQPPRTLRGSQHRLIDPNTNTDAYVRAALGSAYDRVASAPPGSRNDTLNREVFSLARLEVPDALIDATLSEAATTSGLPPHEAQRTIASALRARRSSP
ncbi:MAG TPA: hypothetical protein VGY54_22885 [Polyangiaceae bacterium]|jgi:hypothetical protein|nr:hypothetical protein [Polyangiaceae bacterium]